MLIRTRLRLSLPIALVACAAVPAAASADWHEPVGGASPINASPSRNADAANMAVIGGTPYVAWNEDTTQQGQGSSSTIHVAKLAANGLKWLKVGENGTPNPISLIADTSSDQPSLADVSGSPWVAWQEGVTQTDVEIRVAKFDGTSWNEIPAGTDNPINHPINHNRTGDNGGGDASQATLIDDGTGHPFVSFSEFDQGSGSLLNQFVQGDTFSPGQIWVDQLNQAGDGWNEVGGGSANANPANDALFPAMTVINGVPWVVYWQIIPPNNGPPSVAVDVAHLSGDGQSWVQDGPIVTAPLGNNGFPVGQPSIAHIGTTPYVTFTSSNGGNAGVVVYSFNGTSWSPVGGGPASDPSVDAQSPSIADINGSPWVSWFTDKPSHVIQTAQLSGGAWQPVGSVANNNPNHNASNGSPAGPIGRNQLAVSLTNVNGFPWIGFVEDDQTTPGGNNTPQCCTQVRVSRLEPSFLSDSAEPSDTSATLVTKLQTYGLPYPVRFKWGPGSTLTHTTTPSPASGNPAFSFRSISGLTPSSVYSFMPVATAGTPRPLIQGPEDAFVTQAPPRQPPPGPLYAFILRLPRHVQHGQHVRVRYFVSDHSSVHMVIKHAGNQIAQWRRSVDAGTHSVVWTVGPHAPAGSYVVVLTARSGRRTAADGGTIQIGPRRR
ncbi:MAG: hypothetical protein ACJ764_09995 [Solirubrobacteraceae bacterium]